MRLFQWPFAVLAALIVFAFAPSARADGFFVTLSNGISVARTAGAVLDVSSSAPVSYASGAGAAKSQVTPVHIEIDDWSSAATLFTAVQERRLFSMVVELTAKNAQGTEETYMTLTYANCTVQKWDGTYAAANGSTPVAVTQSFEVLFEKMTQTTPPAAGAGGIRRVMPLKIGRPVVGVRPLAVMKITDAYLTMPSVSPTRVRVSSASFGVTAPRDTASGLGSGKMILAPISINKGPLPSLFSRIGKDVGIATLSFIDQRAAGIETTLVSLNTTNAVVTNVTLQSAGGVNGEAVTYGGVEKLTSP